MSRNNLGANLGPENINGFNPENYNLNNNSSTRGSNSSSNSNNSSNADYSHIWIDIDVIGDGNCFYRSLYHAALFHVDKTAFKRLLLCFCLNVDDYDNENTLKVFATDAAKAAAKKKKYDKELAHEHEFCNAARAALANEIKYKDLFKRMDNADSEDYKSPYAILKEKAELGQELWSAIIAEFSHAFQRKFRRASTFTDMSEGKFANVYADIVRTDREFVSQLEILMVNFMLRHCGLKIHTLNPDGKYRANDIGTLNANNLLAAPVGNIENAGPNATNNIPNASIKVPAEEIKLTPLFLMRLPEHYNVVVPSSVYSEHFAVLDNIGNEDPVQYTDEDLFVNHEVVHAYVKKMTPEHTGGYRPATEHAGDRRPATEHAGDRRPATEHAGGRRHRRRVTRHFRRGLCRSSKRNKATRRRK
jgi:hypothetical protein